jgi:hypothetical protein
VLLDILDEPLEFVVADSAGLLQFLPQLPQAWRGLIDQRHYQL